MPMGAASPAAAAFTRAIDAAASCAAATADAAAARAMAEYFVAVTAHAAIELAFEYGDI